MADPIFGPLVAPYAGGTFDYTPYNQSQPAPQAHTMAVPDANVAAQRASAEQAVAQKAGSGSDPDPEMSQYISYLNEALKSASGEKAKELAQQLQIAQQDYAARIKAAQIGADASKYGSDQSLAGTKYATNGSIQNNQLDNQTSRMNAQTQLAGTEYGADRSLAGTQYASNLSSQASMYGSQLSLEGQQFASNNALNASLYGSDKSAQASMYGADKSATASMYGSDKSADASKYGSDQQLAGTQYSSDASKAASEYGSDQQLAGTKYSSDASAGASRYASDQGLAGSQYTADKGLAGTQYSSDATKAASMYGTDEQRYQAELNAKNAATQNALSFANTYATLAQTGDPFAMAAYNRVGSQAQGMPQFISDLTQKTQAPALSGARGPVPGNMADKIFGANPTLGSAFSVNTQAPTNTGAANSVAGLRSQMTAGAAPASPAAAAYNASMSGLQNNNSMPTGSSFEGPYGTVQVNNPADMQAMNAANAGRGVGDGMRMMDPQSYQSLDNQSLYAEKYGGGAQPQAEATRYAQDSALQPQQYAQTMQAQNYYPPQQGYPQHQGAPQTQAYAQTYAAGAPQQAYPQQAQQQAQQQQPSSGGSSWQASQQAPTSQSGSLQTSSDDTLNQARTGIRNALQQGVGTWGNNTYENMNTSQKNILNGGIKDAGLNADDVKQQYDSTRNLNNAGDVAKA